jgi:hypothetical protein
LNFYAGDVLHEGEAIAADLRAEAEEQAAIGRDDQGSLASGVAARARAAQLALALLESEAELLRRVADLYLRLDQLEVDVGHCSLLMYGTAANCTVVSLGRTATPDQASHGERACRQI